MRKMFYIFTFLLSCAIFSAIFPYPVLSNYTNVPESVIYQQNNFQEIELQPQAFQNVQMLPLDFASINAILPVGSVFEVFDIESGISFNAVRSGGTYHFDIEPSGKADFALICQICNNNFSWQRRPALLKLNEYSYVPASLSLYPHGYNSVQNNDVLGHFCLHFKNSRMDGTKKKDGTHQKCVALASKFKNFSKLN